MIGLVVRAHDLVAGHPSGAVTATAAHPGAARSEAVIGVGTRGWAPAARPWQPPTSVENRRGVFYDRRLRFPFFSVS